MRFVLACVVGAMLAVPAAAGTDRSVRTPQPVRALAAEGQVQRIAFLTAATGGGCGAVWVWRPGVRVQQLAPTPCGPTTSTGRGLYGLSFGEATALWVSYTGGNFREHSVWLARRKSSGPELGRARRVAFVTHDAAESSPVLVGEGDAGVSTYAIGAKMHLATIDAVRSFMLESRPASVAVSSPYAIARLEAGPIVVYDQSGLEQTRFDYGRGVARAVKGSGSQLVVLRVGAVDLHHVERGRIRSWPVPRAGSSGDDHCGSERCALAEVRLADLQGPLAVYMHGRAIHILRVTDGKDVVIRRPEAGPVHAELEASGLSYSAGRRVYFIPRSEVDRRLRSG
jgi:hypothetical protein